MVFRTPAEPNRPRISPVSLPEPIKIDGPWTVSFDGLPKAVTLPGLNSWTEHADLNVKYFAGSARYRTIFQVPAGWQKRGYPVRIELGNLWTIGEVWLNGQSLGVTWTAPFAVEADRALREGQNEIVVEITNTWYNRIVGDAKLLPAQRTTRTNMTRSGDKPWAQLEPVPSGLFGPVRLVTENLR